VKRTWPLVAAAAAILIAAIGWVVHVRSQHPPAAAGPAISRPAPVPAASVPPPTQIHAHNLSLRKGPDFRIFVLWLSGQLVPTRKGATPSLDDPESFVLAVDKGVIHARMADISHYMNTSQGQAMPLQNISITGDKDRISLHGTIYKMHLPLPIGLEGNVSGSPDGRIRVQVDHLSVLKLPLKGVLSGFKLTVADLLGDKAVPGIEASGNDLYFDTQVLLPAPHIRGKLTSVHVANPDIVVVYGDNAQDDATRTEQWHNFLHLKGGPLVFGKLTMRDSDLIMIDASKDPWFDLDLVNYQAQLVYGYIRMTPEAALQIFMPDVDQLPRPKTVTREWIHNRNLPLPAPPVPSRQESSRHK
jgi:hypothetical protein